MAQTVKDLPAMQETRVQSLGWEDPLGGGAWQPTPVFLYGESHGQRIALYAILNWLFLLKRVDILPIMNVGSRTCCSFSI